MLLLTRLLWTQLCPVVDSVLGVVNELLGAVLGKLGSTLLLLCTCCYLSWSSGLRRCGAIQVSIYRGFRPLADHQWGVWHCQKCEADIIII